MQVNVQGKQLDLGDALRTHVSDKLEAINSKYFGRAIDADVTLSPEGPSAYKTHILIRVGKNIQVVGSATEHDPYASFDHAAERVAKQLRRYKKRLRDHHERGPEVPEEAPLAARENIIQSQEDESEEIAGEDDPAVIAEMTRNIEILSVSDAVMQLDLSGEPAMLFRNAKHNELNMIYRRSDGNIGWVDPVQNGK